MVKKVLDAETFSAQYLTMFKNDAVTEKGGETRKHIFECALALFREKGFDATTMQQVADGAGVAKSAAYYYFPGKEAIIQAYYETVQSRQELLCSIAMAETTDLRARLGFAMHMKFDLAWNDRKLLGVVFRYTGEPGHPLSCLGPQTADLRRRAMRVFREAIELERLPEDLEQLLPLALWALQMGLLVMFLYDSSEGQQRTRRTADGALDLTLKLLSLAKLRPLKSVRLKILGLLRDAELLPG